MISHMKYFAVTYDYDPNSPRIAQERPRHREFIAGLKESGTILGSGPFTDSAGGALIVIQFSNEDTTLEQAKSVMNQDPFWSEKLITARTVREWNPVINTFEA